MSAKQPARWLDTTTPVPDVATLTTLELLDLWAANRNSSMAVMAAEEIARRLWRERGGDCG